MSLSHHSFCRPVRRGFNLIELLVVALILSIFMAVSLPLYISVVIDSQVKACRANMQTIANTVQAACVHKGCGDYKSFVGPVSIWKEPDLQAVPICPKNGMYTIAIGSSGTFSTFKVVCSTSGHRTFEPIVDSF